MASQELIRAYEREVTAVVDGSMAGAIKDHAATFLPDISSTVNGVKVLGVPVLSQSMRQDVVEWETSTKTGIVNTVTKWIEGIKIGGKTLGELLSSAISSVVETVYECVGETEQFSASKQVLEQLKSGSSTLEQGIDQFTQSLPQNLRPPKELLAGLTVAGIRDASLTLQATMGDLAQQGQHMISEKFGGTPEDPAKQASQTIAEKVYENVYIGTLEYYKQKGKTQEEAREYATAVAEEYTGLRLQNDGKGNPVLVPAGEGQNGGLRQYFEDVINAGKTPGSKVEEITLHASTPSGKMTTLKAADTALQQPSQPAPEGDDVSPGTPVSPNAPPVVKSPTLEATVGAGK